MGKLVWPVFWTLVGVFVIVISMFSIPPIRELWVGDFRGLLFIMISGALLLLLGGALIFVTIRGKVGGLIKKFLILTGASSAGILISVLLHNALYGLFISWFGADFWERTGVGDEPVFFFIALLVCPIGFLVGIVGSIILGMRGHRNIVL